MKKFKYSEITPEKVYNKRREFVKSLGLGLGSLTLSTIPGLNQSYGNTDLSKLTSYEDVTTYNNYYEFGTGKSDPYNKSQSFKTRTLEYKY
jgi:sulfoxide reductase catalytic subunit YedY